jgi:DNA-binding ferritin-like protein (Dps family)
MYKRINADVNKDLELILKYLTGVSHKVDWDDDDIFNMVLEMRDAALKAHKRIQIPKENPKWDQIGRML